VGLSMSEMSSGNGWQEWGGRARAHRLHLMRLHFGAAIAATLRRTFLICHYRSIWPFSGTTLSASIHEEYRGEDTNDDRYA